MTAADELLDAALDLPLAERLALARALMDSAEHPPGPATPMTREEFLAEMNRRSSDTDPNSWMTLEEMLKSAHEQLGFVADENA
jgi:putative addiction module component (TIGR02574 family)